MRKLAKAVLALCLCVCMLLGCASVSFAEDSTTPDTSIGGGFGGGADDNGSGIDISDYEGPWNWEYRVADDGVAYWGLDVVYCANPLVVDGEAVQHLAIYAPAAYMMEDASGNVLLNPDGQVTGSTGVVYTAENAPILYTNKSNGYSESVVKAVTTDYLKEGFVQVSISTRGKGTQNDAGEYVGQFPAVVVDLKAGIRFLKANDDVLPGNSDRIVSHGASSGGAMSAMLGTSGNASVFEPYLEEIGAADATDDIFIALCYCPITNLDTADAAYEWFQYGNTEYYVFKAMAVDYLGNPLENFVAGSSSYHLLGQNALGMEFEDEMSEWLYDWYVEYIRDLGFDLSEDGQSGTYSTGLAELYAQGLAEYIARYDELDYSDHSMTAQQYLDSIQNEDDPWFTYDPVTGEVTINSLVDVIVGYVPRAKMSPSLDSYNKQSNEGTAFVTEDGNYVHFSYLVRDALKAMLDNYDEDYWDDPSTPETLQTLYDIYAEDITEESTAMLETMSPINYILGNEGYDDATIAPYFRWQIGSLDGDHGLPAAWLAHNALEKYHSDSVTSEISVIWAKPHSDAEYDYQDLYDYIGEVMVAEDGLTVWSNPFTDVSSTDYFFAPVLWASAENITNGITATTFDPNGVGTRAQAVTFLWRAAGSPVPTGTENPFTDVVSGTYYYDAVLWAMENGITNGTSDTTFSPNDPVNRSQFVTFLWRIEGMPAAQGVNSFVDVATNSYYADAVQWAVSSGITNGTSDTTFSPNANCIRAQAVTFLYRNYVG